MRRRRLGRTGLLVSEISLGTVELGLDYGIADGGEAKKPDERSAAALLNFALDSGINLIDTARAYGSSERIIGSALKTRRSEYILASKVKPQPGNPAAVHELVEQSLRELQTDSIDILMIHCGMETEPCTDTVGALQQLRQSGKIRFIGSSVYGVEAARAAISSGWFDCLEVAYSVLDRRPEADVFDLAEKNDIGIVARSVLLKGALTERCRLLPDGLAPLKQTVERLAALASSFQKLPEFAYRYVLSRTPPHSVLVGTANHDELAASLEYAAQGPLSVEQIAAARDIEIADEQLLNPGNWPKS